MEERKFGSACGQGWGSTTSPESSLSLHSHYTFGFILYFFSTLNVREKVVAEAACE